MTRGKVVPLTAEQRRTRMRYLAGEVTFRELDPYVVSASAIDGSTKCATGYYLLKEHNGGKDPAAIDPFDHWSKDGSTFVNVTADCIGGQAWCGGFDRYQEKRFSHIYDGWINTDSMLLDARGPAKCFKLLDAPEVGCFVVFASGSGGHAIGHIGGVTDVPAHFDAHAIDCWRALGVVDMAARVGRGNMRGNPLTWYYAAGSFVRPIMQP